MLRRPWSLVLALLLLVPIALTSSVPAAVAAPVGRAAPLKVLLLGDSYSAGNGAGAYYGPGACHRSKKNWAERYVRWLTAEGHPVTFVNRACSGGVTADYAGARSFGIPRLPMVPGVSKCRAESPDENAERRTVDVVGPDPTFCLKSLDPQSDAVDKSVDLVLFTFGGNDIAFSEIVQSCFILYLASPNGCQNKVDAAEASLGTLQSDLTNILLDMRSKLRPDAKIIFMGYPQLVSEGFSVNSLDVRGRVEGSYDLDNVRDLGSAGAASQQAAVKAANAAAKTDFVTYEADVITTFSGHEPQPRPHSNKDRWLLQAADSLDRDEWYHPNGQGHDAYAKLLEDRGEPGVGRPAATAGSIDLVFTIDTTGSMGGVIEAVKQQVTATVDRLSAGSSSYRMAVVSYRDHPETTGDDGDYPARVDQGFTTGVGAIKAAVSRLTADGGGDYPESAYSGATAALDLPWRAGVKKQMIIFSDAPAHDPEPVSGLTAEQVNAHSRSIDPVVINVVDAGGAGDLGGIVSGTGGQRVAASSPDEIAAAMEQLVTDSLQDPYAWAGEQYLAAVGSPVTFDASGSYDPGGEPLTYAWDVDDDGTPDATTTEPTYTHTYEEPYDGMLAVTVTRPDGRSATATVPVAVDRDGDGIDGAADVCPDVADLPQTDEDGDGVGDACDPTPGYPTADPPGVSITGPGDVPPPGPGAGGPAPALASASSLTLTNQARTTGGGDVVVDGDFACSSQVSIDGDLVASGDVRLDNTCHVGGDVRAGGSVELVSKPTVGGDVVAAGGVRLQSTARVAGSVTAGGDVVSSDGRTVERLRSGGTVAGEIRARQTVASPTLPEAAAPTAEAAGAPTVTWKRWLNDVATAHGAPSWASGRRADPGCTMATKRYGVGEGPVVVSAPTVVDARSAASGCSSVSLQQVRIELGADLTVVADSLRTVNGLDAVSADGQPHRLRVVVPGQGWTCDASRGVELSGGTVVDPLVTTDVLAAGRVGLQGTSSLTGRVTGGCVRSSGAVTLAAPAPVPTP